MDLPAPIREIKSFKTGFGHGLERDLNFSDKRTQASIESGNPRWAAAAAARRPIAESVDMSYPSSIVTSEF